MKHRFIAAATLALTACAADPLAKYAGKPITCASFATQAEAQVAYEQHIELWWELDPRLTGRACADRWPS
jgi:hypothetical protein